MENEKVTLQAHEAELEALVDRYGLSAVLMQLASIASDKADHIRASYDDKPLATSWDRAAGYLAMVAAGNRITKVSP